MTWDPKRTKNENFDLLGEEELCENLDDCLDQEEVLDEEEQLVEEDAWEKRIQEGKRQPQAKYSIW